MFVTVAYLQIEEGGWLSYRRKFPKSCQSACKRDPFWGVIGVEKGPPFGTGMKATRQSG